MFDSIEKKSLASEVFDQLRGHIVSGSLSVGDALPAERVLAERLGVSRAAVREGLKRLEQAGLISIQQGGSTRVLDYRQTGGLELLGHLMIEPDGNIDTAVVRGVIELRAHLGSLVARQAADRRTHHQVERLRDILAQMMIDTGRVALLQQHALDFWEAMVACSHNVALQLAFNSLVRSYTGVMEQTRDLVAAEVSALADYQRLVAAVDASQPKDAERAANDILALGTAAFTELLALLDGVQGGAR